MVCSTQVGGGRRVEWRSRLGCKAGSRPPSQPRSTAAGARPPAAAPSRPRPSRARRARAPAPHQTGRRCAAERGAGLLRLALRRRRRGAPWPALLRPRARRPLLPALLPLRQAAGRGAGEGRRQGGRGARGRGQRGLGGGRRLARRGGGGAARAGAAQPERDGARRRWGRPRGGRCGRARVGGQVQSRVWAASRGRGRQQGPRGGGPAPRTCPPSRGPRAAPPPPLRTTAAAPAAGAGAAAKRYTKARPYFARVAALQGLCTVADKATDKDTVRVALDLGDSGLEYHPGDALGMYPTNPAAVRARAPPKGLAGLSAGLVASEPAIGHATGASSRLPRLPVRGRAPFMCRSASAQAPASLPLCLKALPRHPPKKNRRWTRCWPPWAPLATSPCRCRPGTTRSLRPTRRQQPAPPAPAPCRCAPRSRAATTCDRRAARHC
jgi:hypothetical protein